MRDIINQSDLYGRFCLREIAQSFRAYTPTQRRVQNSCYCVACRKLFRDTQYTPKVEGKTAGTCAIRRTSWGFLRTRERGGLIQNSNTFLKSGLRGRFASIANTAHTVLHGIPPVLEGSSIGTAPGPVGCAN